jgi:hypothetical protein
VGLGAGQQIRLARRRNPKSAIASQHHGHPGSPP